MYTNDRATYRNSFSHVWQKHLQNADLSSQEYEIAQVIKLHPEYHALLQPECRLNENYCLEENPFLHIGLHLAIREHIRINLPKGIKEIYISLIAKYSEHEVEHKMMTCLAQIMWEAQKIGEMPSQEIYLKLLRELE